MVVTDRLASVPARAVVEARAAVGAWLWSVAALVFLMVMVGGATRLTESGLSITEWKLVSGILPPLSEAGWQAEFDRYKQIPQYAKLFPFMSLGQFQFIYGFEWFHRLLGRLIGVAFAGPLVWFWVRGQLPASLKPKLVGVLGLGALQGVVGWWMVKSGLSERVEVSQVRLAVHLLLASVTYAALVWLAVGLTTGRAERLGRAAAGLRAGATVIVGLVLAQIGLGALVAGLRAGLIYNTWPLMDGRFVPRGDELFNLSPWWTNLFGNVATVQFEHRMTAYGLFAVGLGYALYAMRAAPRSRASARAVGVAAMIGVQACIGITTLLLAVPLWAGLLHQAFAMLVLGAAVLHRRLLSAGEEASAYRGAVAGGAMRRPMQDAGSRLHNG